MDQHLCALNNVLILEKCCLCFTALHNTLYNFRLNTYFGSIQYKEVILQYHQAPVAQMCLRLIRRKPPHSGHLIWANQCDTKAEFMSESNVRANYFALVVKNKELCWIDKCEDSVWLCWFMFQPEGTLLQKVLPPAVHVSSLKNNSSAFVQEVHHYT